MNACGILLYNMQSILGHLTPSEAGHGTVQEATDRVVDVAQHINAVKRRDEHRIRRQELQTLLQGVDRLDLASFGELILEVWHIGLSK